MEGDVRVLLVALFYDLLISSSCFLAFLYLRKLRGDQRQRGVRTLQTVRSARGPLNHHRSPLRDQSARGSFSAPASPTGGNRQGRSDGDELTDDDNHDNVDIYGRDGSQSCRYVGLGGWRIGSTTAAGVPNEHQRDTAYTSSSMGKNPFGMDAGDEHYKSSGSGDAITLDPEVPRSRQIHTPPELTPLSPSSAKDHNTQQQNNKRRFPSSALNIITPHYYQCDYNNNNNQYNDSPQQQQQYNTMTVNRSPSTSSSHYYRHPHYSTTKQGTVIVSPNLKCDDDDDSNTTTTTAINNNANVHGRFQLLHYSQHDDSNSDNSDNRHHHDSRHIMNHSPQYSTTQSHLVNHRNYHRHHQTARVIPALRSAFAGTTSSSRQFPSPRSPHHHHHRHHHHDDDENQKMFGWLKVLFQIEDKRFQSTDVQFYLLFLKTCQRITFALSLVALLVILPTNLSCPSKSSAEGWLDRASAENISADDGRIWVLMVCTWIYSFVIYFFIYRFWMGVCNPILLWNSDSFNPEAYTLMVEGVSRSEISPSILSDHFERLFPDKVVCANLVLDFSELLKAKRDLEETMRHLTRAETLQVQASPPHQPPASSPLLSSELLPTNEDLEGAMRDPSVPNRSIEPTSEQSVELYIPRPSPRRSNAVSADSASLSLHSLTPWATRGGDVGYWRSLAERRTLAVDGVLAKRPSKNAGVGFVSFRETSCVTQCLEDPRAVGNHYDWHFSPAPPPQDVLWMNIHISKPQRIARGIALNFFLIFVSVVLTSSAMLTNALLPLAENVEKAFNEADFLKLSVTGWGAPLILFTINSLFLPIMVQWVANSIGYWRMSDIESTVLHGNVTFLVLNTVIFPTLGNGSIGALIAQIYNTQIQKWNISLGRLIVGQSGSFALRYLLNGCFLHSASQLLQLAQLSWFGVLSIFRKDTEQWNFDFGYSYAFCLSIFFMVISFGVVVPLVLPFGCLFFTLKYFVDKYNFIFGIWKVEQESAGAVASIASRYILAAVAFLQFVMSGYFVAFGLRLASRDSDLPPPDDLVSVVTSGISPGRGLVLGGTLLFVVSLVSTVLLIGHSASVAKPRHPHASGHLGTPLTPEQEQQLRRSYIHPYEHESEERLRPRHTTQ